MGEVWRAEDTKLGRDVALKVLPDSFAEDAERLERFEREARVLAALSHPNIAGIHGLEDVDGKRFLVMEVAEGETLSERIGRGPLPVEDAVRIAVQIAQAVEVAHDEGHRPPRPETQQRRGDPGGPGQGPRLRPRQGPRNPPPVGRLGAKHPVPHPGPGDDAGRDAAGDRRLHEPRAGAGQAGRSPNGHLGLRMRALRNARGTSGLRRGNGDGRPRRDRPQGAGDRQAPLQRPAEDPSSARAVSAEGRLASTPVDRRRADCAGGVARETRHRRGAHRLDRAVAALRLLGRGRRSRGRSRPRGRLVSSDTRSRAARALQRSRAARTDGDGLAPPLARRTAPGVQRHRRIRHHADLDSTARRPRGAARGGHRGGSPTLLVARQSAPGLLRGRPAQEGRRVRGPGTDTLRRSHWLRRLVESRGRHPLRRPHQRANHARRGSRGSGPARGRAGSGERAHRGGLARVPPGRPAFPLRGHPHRKTIDALCT